MSDKSYGIPRAKEVASLKIRDDFGNYYIVLPNLEVRMVRKLKRRGGPRKKKIDG